MKLALNTIQSPFYRKGCKRVGRGIGCTDGKTSGRGHKGQKARKGYSRNWAFEGGQTNLVRRLPKSGFVSLVKPTPTVTLARLSQLPVDINHITLELLQVHGMVHKNTKEVRILATLPYTRDFTFDLNGVYLTAGVKKLAVHE
jgi:large subunit ribosomal protein L15